MIDTFICARAVQILQPRERNRYSVPRPLPTARWVATLKRQSLPGCRGTGQQGCQSTPSPLWIGTRT
ncbi:hypothetical protein BX600DRAFT_49435 [Xylariales sp. PMI_506]|nr:hypothetical protein BX600DRAFT_49435 [Xylariales sp. PMI_506]